MTRHAALPVLAAAALLAAAAPTMAQSSLAPAGGAPAAARLPNTFDNAPAVPAPASAPAPQAAPAAEAMDPARAAAAEAMLKTTIAAMQAGSPNYDDMSDDLAEKVREQSTAITPLIQSFGAVTSVTHVGVERGAELFMVEFANQRTQWIIAQGDDGKIIALLFRPAPAGG
jgi:hypothetical protein